MNQNDMPTTPINSSEKASKKKYAVLYGYCGTGYQGSQANKGTKTIDDDLLEGLYKAGCISEQNYNDDRRFVKNGWNRAARTDKGVHAAGNVVSCKLEVVSGKEKETVEKINSQLPAAIRVYKIVKTTKSFCAKNFCDRRQYEYLLPVYAIEPFNKEEPPCSVSEDIRQNWTDFAAYEEYLQNPTESSFIPEKSSVYKSLEVAKGILDSEDSLLSYTPDAQDASFGGTLSPSEWPSFLKTALSRIRACTKLFLGTHNFHNYTVGKSPMDPSAQRHLLCIIVSDPVRIHNELYLRVRLEGQSFMLHQIRKMMGISVEVARGRCTLFKVYSSMSTGKMITPLAPSTGLFLDKPMFRDYNKKMGEDAEKIIDFDDPTFEKERCEFKRVQIYEHIDDNIRAENAFCAWLAFNDGFNLDYVAVFPSKEDCAQMEKEAVENCKRKKDEKWEKWEKKRKIEKEEPQSVYSCLMQIHLIWSSFQSSSETQL